MESLKDLYAWEQVAPGKRSTAEVSKSIGCKNMFNVYPVTVIVRKLIGAHDLLRRFQNHLGRDRCAINLLPILVDLGELDIESNELVFSWYHHNAPRFGAVYGASHPDIG